MLNILCQGWGWFVNQFGQTSSDRTRSTQWAFPFLYFLFSAPSTKLTWDGQHIALCKLRNPQVGSEEGFF